MSHEGNDRIIDSMRDELPPDSVNKCFQCGSALEERKGYVYCTKPNTGISVSMYDVRTCYYTWNTHPKNRIIASLEELHRRVYGDGNETV